MAATETWRKGPTKCRHLDDHHEVPEYETQVKTMNDVRIPTGAKPWQAQDIKQMSSLENWSFWLTSELCLLFRLAFHILD